MHPCGTELWYIYLICKFIFLFKLHLSECHLRMSQNCHLTAANVHFLILVMCLCLEGVFRVLFSRLIFMSLIFCF